MWQRWNQSTHIFEKSDDNGVIWVPLPLNASVINEGNLAAARMPPNVAYRDIDNSFVAQHINGGSIIGDPNAMLNFNMSTAPTGSRCYRFINYGVGDFRFEGLTDGFASVIGTPFTVNPSGDMYHGRNVFAGSGGYYELNRAVPLGYWQDVPYNAADYTADSGMTVSMAAAFALSTYTVIGKTLLWVVNFNGFTLGGTANGNVRIKIPGGFSSAFSGSVATVTINNGAAATGWRTGVVNAGVGGTTLDFIQLPNFVWTRGAADNYIWGLVVCRIQ